MAGKTPTRTHGPRLTENIVQALARIVITEQMLEVHNMADVDVVLQIHDEIISLGSSVEPDKTLNNILGIMKTAPKWCADLPLDAEGNHSTRYDK